MMSGRIWIGLVAVVAIVGVGAWLGGLFDEEDSYETVPPPRVGEG